MMYLARRMKSLGIVFISAAFGYTAGWAQESKQIPPPTPPLVAAVPTNGDWTVSAQSSAGTGPKWQIAQVRTTKTGKIRREKITVGDGSVSERWCTDTMFFWTSPEGDVIVNDLREAMPTEPDDPSPSVLSGFPGVKWIKLDNYAGVAVIDKRPCYHFKKDNIEAWIDVETKFPVMYRSRDTTYQFKFNETPVQSLTISKEHQDALDFVQKAMDHRRQLEKDLR